MKELIEKTEEYISKAGKQNLDASDIDYLGKVVDIYKDLKEVESMNGSYRNYEAARYEYNNGNYGAKEDGLKELDYMMHAAMKFIKMIKEEATSPEEQEIVRKHIMKISEM